MYKPIMIALLVIFWNISSIHSKSSCTFSKADLTWNCANQHLISIPILEIMEKPALRLKFGNNYIESIENLKLLPYRINITEILLNDNMLEKLPPNLRDIVPNLETLNLANNQITHIQNEFHYSEHLENLYLDYNPIQRFSSNAFMKVANLKKLTLRHTNFTPTNKAMARWKRNPNLEILTSPPNFFKSTSATTTNKPMKLHRNLSSNYDISTNKSTEDENKTSSGNTIEKSNFLKIILLLLFVLLKLQSQIRYNSAAFSNLCSNNCIWESYHQ